MNLSGVIPYVHDLLERDASLLKAIPRVDQTDSKYNDKFEAALKEPGVCLVIWLTGGNVQDGAADKRAVLLDNFVTLAVVENPAKNSTGKSALEWVELVLTTLHMAGWPKAPGRSNINMDAPTYDLGPLRTGLVTYFVTFRVKSENALTPSVV